MSLNTGKMLRMVNDLEVCMKASAADWKSMDRLDGVKSYIIEEMRRENAFKSGGKIKLNRYKAAVKFLESEKESFNFTKVHTNMSGGGVYTQTLTNGFVGIVLKASKKIDFGDDLINLDSKIVTDIERCFEDAYKNYSGAFHTKTVSIQSMRDAVIAAGQSVSGKSPVNVFFEDCGVRSCFDARKVLTALEICGLTEEVSVTIQGTLMIFDDKETEPDCKFIIAGINPEYENNEK
jgi:hypothetical protein